MGKLGGHKNGLFSKYFTIWRNPVLTLSLRNLNGFSFWEKCPKYPTFSHLLDTHLTSTFIFKKVDVCPPTFPLCTGKFKYFNIFKGQFWLQQTFAYKIDGKGAIISRLVYSSIQTRILYYLWFTSGHPYWVIYTYCTTAQALISGKDRPRWNYQNKMIGMLNFT